MANYDLRKFPADTELDGFDNDIDLGAGDKLFFMNIPSGVKLYFTLNNNSNTKIEAKQGLVLDGEYGHVYLWSVGTSTTETIDILQVGGGFNITMPPQQEFNSLNEFGLVAEKQLQKANFFAPRTALQHTITTGTSYPMILTDETIIRFHCSDQVGVELNTDGIKYPMYEEELNVENLTTLDFHNDNASDVILTVWIS